MPLNNCSRFATDVAAELTGKDKKYFEGCCGQDEISAEQISGMNFLTEILDAIFAIMDRCESLESFTQRAKQPDLFTRVFFKRRAFKKPWYEFEGQRYSRSAIAEKMIDCCQGTSEQVIAATWEEVRPPDVSPFFAVDPASPTEILPTIVQ